MSGWTNCEIIYGDCLEHIDMVISETENPVIVIDPFIGSGITGVACARLGVPFIGVEMDSKYFEIAEARLDFEFAQGHLFWLQSQA